MTIPIQPSHFTPLDEGDPACDACADGASLGLAFSYAYQPIVDVRNRSIYAHEALVRGPAGESAYTVLSRLNDSNRYRFDQACRVKAIKGAAQIGMRSRLWARRSAMASDWPPSCASTSAWGS
jgi:hypothetical protein